MTKTRVALVAAVLTLPLVSFAGTAGAAATHNLQAGTRTSNAYDTIETAFVKQVNGAGERRFQDREPSAAFGR